MRRAHCGSQHVHMWAKIIVDDQPARSIYCVTCKRKSQTAYCSRPKSGFKMDADSIRKRAIAYSVAWAKKPEAYKKKIYAKRNAARIKALGLCQPKVKEGFIGKLGDIEVYALRVGRMGR